MSGLSATLMTPAGPVAAAFGASPAFIKGIMGPVGSAKTTECIANGFRVGLAQKPVWDPARGAYVKRHRGAVVRDTYPNLDRTVIKSWHTWFPKTLGRWVGEAPRLHAFTVAIGQPGEPGFHLLDTEVIFTAIGDRSVEDVLRGLELTWLWPNEWDLLPRTILELGAGRVGRYPSMAQGGCQFAQIFGDFNAPEEDNHLVKLFSIDGEQDAARLEAFAGENGGNAPVIEFFRQPGGLEDGAENLHNLPGGRAYYTKQAATLQAHMKRRMVDNRLGPVRSGTPCYPEFSDTWHVGEFEIDPKLPLLIGADQGICPGVVIAQLDPVLDQLRVIDEAARIFEEDDGSIVVSQMGGEAFGREVATKLTTRYPGTDVGLACCDPAGAAGEQAINASSWRRDFQKGLGIHVRKARVPGNAIEPRMKPVRDRLTASVRGCPKILVHKRCTILKRAFNTKYVWQRISVGSVDGGRFGSSPVKVQGYSDVMNALEYLAFEVERGVEMNAVGSARGRRGRAITNDMGGAR